MAHRFAIALAMPKHERIRRWKLLIETVREDNVTKWREDFVGALIRSRQVSEPVGPEL